MSDKLDYHLIDAINEKIERLTCSTMPTPAPAPSGRSASGEDNESEFDDDDYEDNDGFAEDMDEASGVAPSATSSKMDAATGQPYLVRVPSQVPEELDVEFRDANNRYRFPAWGLIIEKGRSGTLFGVHFIACTFNAFDPTLFDDCVLQGVVFHRCHFQGSQILNVVAKGTRFHECTFDQSWWLGLKLADESYFIGKRFEQERVIQEEVPEELRDDYKVVAAKEQSIQDWVQDHKKPPREAGQPEEKQNRVFREQDTMAKPQIAGTWRRRSTKPPSPGELIDFEDTKAEAKSSWYAPTLKPDTAIAEPQNWQHHRISGNAVKLVNTQHETVDTAPSFAPTNFVKFDFDADPADRKVEITDHAEIEKRQTWSKKSQKNKQYWAAQKKEHGRF